MGKGGVRPEGRRGQRKGNEGERRAESATQVKRGQDTWLARPQVSAEAANPVTAPVRPRN